MTLIFIMIMTMTITFMMMMIASTLSKKSLNDREFSSPFECGFDPKSTARIPFSLQFFMIAVIFLIFDVEIALIMPIIPIMYYNNTMTLMMLTTLFIMILLMGLYYEWNQGALEWKK